MALSLLSTILASVSVFTASMMDHAYEPKAVKYAQLQIEPEQTGLDSRVQRGARALAQAYPETDLSVLVYTKFGLHNIELFEIAANEWVADLGAGPTFENPVLMLRIQSVDRRETPDGESETFGLTLQEGSKTIAASRTTVNCQGDNIAKRLQGDNREGPVGCLVDSATVTEMFGRLADKI